jgi:hypothetical protein
MSNKKTLRPEMAFVIPFDPYKETVYLQQKDDTYWVEPFRLKHCLVGTGIRSEKRENRLTALKRKLEGEMPFAEKMITDDMQFWKEFHLPWGTPIVENKYATKDEYICHVFVRIMASRYEMMKLEDDIRSGGDKHATPTHITVDRFKQIPPEKFMGSLNVVATEFLKEIETDSEQFWDRLIKKK